MKLKVQFLIAIVVILTIYISAVQAQANLTFSGGNGSPLTITLQQSVLYTINNTQCSTNSGPVFVFKQTGNPFMAAGFGNVGTTTFSINGGTAQPITRAVSGFSFGNISANDIYIFGNLQSVSNTSMVVLNAGTVITSTGVPGAPPANGSYITFITSGTGIACSTNGQALVPTAASVSISGRVSTNNRRGLAKAFVYLTDSEGNTRAVRTSSFGYYRFNDIAAGQTVTITVVSKRYQFAPVVVNVNEEISGLNFLAEQ